MSDLRDNADICFDRMLYSSVFAVKRMEERKFLCSLTYFPFRKIGWLDFLSHLFSIGQTYLL